MTLLDDYQRELLVTLRKIEGHLASIVAALESQVLATRRQAQALEYRNLGQANKVRAAMQERARLLRRSKEATP